MLLPQTGIFASPRMKGRKPYRANTLVANHLKVAAAKAGITGPVGWHSGRRSISGWLIDNDENVKVTQELMRHAIKNYPGPICKGSNAVEASSTREDC
jgi:hypothetical protein